MLLFHLYPPESTKLESSDYDSGNLVAWGLFGGCATIGLALFASFAFSGIGPEPINPGGLLIGEGIGVAVSVAVPLFAASPPAKKKAVLASLIGSVCGFLVAGTVFGVYAAAKALSVF